MGSYHVEATSAAPPERVFALLADTPNWKRWAGFFIGHSSWVTEGTPAPGGVGAVRKLGRAPVFSREEIVEYDPPKHMAYTITGGAPVRGYRADIDLEPAGGGTHIRWRGTFEPIVPGTGALIQAMYRRLVGGFARKAAAYAETNR